jgi:hypothetical protein
VLAGEVVEIEQHIEVVGDLRDRFGPLRTIGRSERLRGLPGVVAVFGVVYLCWMSTKTALTYTPCRRSNLATAYRFFLSNKEERCPDLCGQSPAARSRGRQLSVGDVRERGNRQRDGAGEGRRPGAGRAGAWRVHGAAGARCRYASTTMRPSPRWASQIAPHEKGSEPQPAPLASVPSALGTQRFTISAYSSVPYTRGAACRRHAGHPSRISRRRPRWRPRLPAM